MRTLRWLPWWLTGGALLTAFVIWISLTTSDVELAESISDKRGHVIAYFVLTTWFSGQVQRRRLPWVALALLALGVALEFIQLTSGGGRLFEVADLVANVIGVGLGVLAATAGLAGWCEWCESRLTAD